MVSGISGSFLQNPEISLVVNFLTNGLFHVLQMIIAHKLMFRRAAWLILEL